MPRSARPVRAISIRQPYVELILRRLKTKEFRSRPTNIRGRVYIYAALSPANNTRAWTKAKAEPGDFRTGAIIATVEIAGCGWIKRQKEYGYRLLKPKRLTRALYPKNQPQPGFWRPKF